MKEGIHPEYIDATISCACGNVVKMRATVPTMHVDICSKCHPFFTGKKQQFVDRGGRIEQFNRRYKKDAGDVASSESTESPAEESAAEESPAQEAAAPA